MKNLEALETLKHKWIAGNVIYDEDTDRHTRYLKYDDRLIEEAIKELEALQNRSCSNCKYNKDQDNFMIFCDCVMCQDESKMMWHSYTKDFCCNKWESK